MKELGRGIATVGIVGAVAYISKLLIENLGVVDAASESGVGLTLLLALGLVTFLSIIILWVNVK